MNDQATQALAPSFAAKLLAALRKLTEECEPHPCGGFTTDDLEWRMGTAFTPQETLDNAIEELSQAKAIRYAGYDENDAIGHCYELAPQSDVRSQAPQRI